MVLMGGADVGDDIVYGYEDGADDIL